MNTHILIAIIRNLELPQNTSFNISNWLVTNDPSEINRAIPNARKLSQSLGGIFSKMFNTVALALSDSEREFHAKMLDEQSASLASLLSLTWLLSDNAIFHSALISQNTNDHSVAISFRNDYICNSKALHNIQKLNQNQICEIRDNKLIDNFNLLLFSSGDSDASLAISTAEEVRRYKIEKYYHKYSRLQRAYVVLSFARKADFIILKIAFYINTLETLLLNNDAELSFRLKIYTAKLIGTTKPEIEEISKLLGKAYDIRSKFFHGSSFKSGILEGIEDLSEKLDSIVRRVILKALEKHEILKDNDKWEQYLNSIIL